MLKKSLAWLLTVALCMSVFAGCGAKKTLPPVSSDSSSKVTEDKVEEKPAQASDTLVVTTAGAVTPAAGIKHVIIEADGVILENAKLETITVSEKLGDGTATLKNVKAKILNANGGGEHSIIILDSDLVTLIANRKDGKQHITINVGSTVKTFTIESEVIADIEGAVEKLVVEDKAKDPEVNILANSRVVEMLIKALTAMQIDAEVESVSITGDAENSTMEVGKGGKVGTLATDVPMTTSGEGAIGTLVTNNKNNLKGSTLAANTTTISQNPLNKNVEEAKPIVKKKPGAVTPPVTPPPAADETPTPPPATASVTGIELVKAPNKTLFCDDDKLELDGMQCKLTRSDGTTLIVDAKDFAKNNITTVPAQGSTIDAWHNPMLHDYATKPMDIVAKYSDTQFTCVSKVKVCQDSAKYVYSQAEFEAALNNDQIVCVVLKKNPIEEYEVPKGLKCKDKFVFVDDFCLKEFYRLGTAESATKPNMVYVRDSSSLRWTDKNGYQFNLLVGTKGTSNTTIKVQPKDSSYVTIELNGDKKVKEITIFGNATIGGYLFEGSTEGLVLNGTNLIVQGKVTVRNSANWGPEGYPESDPNAGVTDRTKKVPTIKLVNGAKIIIREDIDLIRRSELVLEPGSLIIAEQGEKNFEIGGKLTNNAGTYDGTTVKGLVGIVDKNLTPVVFTPKKAQAELTITSKDKVTYGDTSLILTATGGEPTIGKRVVYEIISDTNKIAKYEGGNAIDFSGAGSVTIRATKLGNAEFKDITATQTITVAPKALTVTGAKATDKVYNGKQDVALTGGTLVGVINNDAVALATLTGTAAAKDVAAAAAVTTNYTLTGAKAANYTITQPTDVTVKITAAPLTITSPAATARKYDGTTEVDLTGTLTGMVNGELPVVIALKAGSKGTASADIGAKLAVKTKYELEGTGAGNYALTQPTDVTVTIDRAAAKATLTSAVTSVQGATELTTKLSGLTGATEYDYILNGTATPIAADSALWTTKATGTALMTDSDMTAAKYIHIRENADLKYYMPAEDFVIELIYKPIPSYGITMPAAVTTNGVKATLTGAATAQKGSQVDLTLTLTGTPDATGTLTMDVTSTKAGTITTQGAKTIKITSGTAIAADTKYVYTMTMPNEAVDDLVITFTYQAKTPQAPLAFSSPDTATYGDAALTLVATGGEAAITNIVTYAITSDTSSIATLATDKLTFSGAGSVTVTATKPGNADYADVTQTQVITVAQKALTVTGATVADKVYDGTTAVVLTGGTLVGVINNDDVTLATPTGTVVKDVAVAAAVTTNYTLTGAKAANYTLTKPTDVKVKITAAPLTITSPAATAREYDGTTEVALTGTLTGVVNNEAAEVIALAAAHKGTASANIGDNLTVLTDYKLTGTGVDNYALKQPEGVTVTISKKTAATALTGITSEAGATTGTTKLVGAGLVDGTTYEYIINSAITAIDVADASWKTLTMTGADLKKDFAVTEATPHIHIREKVNLAYQEAGAGFDLALTVKAKTPQTITLPVITGGDVAKVGTVLTAAGTYVANDGGAAGAHTYTWYRSDDAANNTATDTVVQASAATPTYTPKAADFGKYIYYVVVPVGDGTLTGVAVNSAVTAAIGNGDFKGTKPTFVTGVPAAAADVQVTTAAGATVDTTTLSFVVHGTPANTLANLEFKFAADLPAVTDAEGWTEAAATKADVAYTTGHKLYIRAKADDTAQLNPTVATPCTGLVITVLTAEQDAINKVKAMFDDASTLTVDMLNTATGTATATADNLVAYKAAVEACTAATELDDAAKIAAIVTGVNDAVAAIESNTSVTEVMLKKATGLAAINNYAACERAITAATTAGTLNTSVLINAMVVAVDKMEAAAKAPQTATVENTVAADAVLTTTIGGTVYTVSAPAITTANYLKVDVANFKLVKQNDTAADVTEAVTFTWTDKALTYITHELVPCTVTIKQTAKGLADADIAKAKTALEAQDFYKTISMANGELTTATTTNVQTLVTGAAASLSGTTCTVKAASTGNIVRADGVKATPNGIDGVYKFTVEIVKANGTTVSTNEMTITTAAIAYAVNDITETALTLTAPDSANAAAATAPTGISNCTSGDVVWTDDKAQVLATGSKFVSGTVYTATFTLTASDHYKFPTGFTPTCAGATTVTPTVGAYAENNTCKVVIVFPAATGA